MLPERGMACMIDVVECPQQTTKFKKHFQVYGKDNKKYMSSSQVFTQLNYTKKLFIACLSIRSWQSPYDIIAAMFDSLAVYIQREIDKVSKRKKMFDITNAKITVYDVDGTEICEDVKTTAAENVEETVIDIVGEVCNNFDNIEEECDISEAEIKQQVAESILITDVCWPLIHGHVEDERRISEADVEQTVVEAALGTEICVSLTSFSVKEESSTSKVEIEETVVEAEL